MEKMITQLNEFLSDLEMFNIKLQNYHWNVVGKGFFTTHEKLEEYYNEINEQIDEVAEHILAIGGVPLATLKDYLNTTKITEAKNEKVTCEVVFSEIVKDYNELLQDSKNIKVLADENNEYKTSALMDDIIKDYSKKIWMIKQSME